MKYRFNRDEARIYCFGVCLLLVASTVLPGMAQTSTSRLTGVVQDISGAIIPGARIAALNTKTQIMVETFTNDAGIFILPALPPGTYTVTAEAQGFKKVIHTDVILNVSETVSEAFKLEVGSLTESVTVEATAQRVNTSDGQVANVITMKDIDVLPQLGRTPITLAVFQAGVQVDGGDATFSRVNGLRQGSNNSKLDGIDVNDAVVPRLGLSLTANNTDSVGEFRIVTNGGKAEYGRSAGAQVELITRSGTNRWSGNGFGYFRDTSFNANNFFNNSSLTPIARPGLVQKIFGGSLGGPILKDKTFIFGNYQGRRTDSEVVRNRTVLTPEAKSGIFRWKAPGTGALQTFDIVANDPRKKGIDPAMANILKLLPGPNNFDIGDGLNTGGFRFNNPSGSMEDQFTIRGDHNLTSNNRLFYRHSWQRNSSLDALNSADSRYPGQPSGTQGGHRWGLAAGSDWTINPRLINEFRYGHQSANVAFNRVRLPQAMILSNSFDDPLNPAFAQGRNSPVNEFTDNITFVKERHAFKAGANIRYTTQYGYNDAGIYPNVTLARANGNTPSTVGPASGISSTDRTTFENIYNDLLGRMDNVAQTFYSDLTAFQKPGTPRVRNFKFHEYGFFFQDDWRIRPNFIVNLGLRYEFSGVPFEIDKLQGTVDKAALVNGVNQISDLTVQRSTSWYNNDWNNFAPRLGFAWSPGNDNKTSIRGGWGLYYDRIIGATTSVVDGNTPGFSQAGRSNPNITGTTDVRISDGIPLPAQPAAPVLQVANGRVSTISIFQPNLRTGYVNHINLSISRELFRNTVLEVGYVGTRGIKLFVLKDLNQTRVSGDFLQSFLQLQAFRLNGTAVPAGNTLVRIFGSVNAAITGVGGTSTVDQGLVGTASNNVDRNNYTKYAAAGVSDFYLRNYPQFNQVQVGTNDGRSYYNSMQVSLRRQTGALKMAVNYTWSKSMDNISVDGNGFTAPIDNYNLRLNRARGDYDRRHSANWAVTYTLPIGKNHWIGGGFPGWADRILGGWDLGALGLWQSGSVFTVSSGRSTYNVNTNSWANYTGDRNIGTVIRQGDGIFLFTPEQKAQFTYAKAGEYGSSGRNAFRGPRFFNMDMSLVKRFRISERHSASFRAEAYNVLNNPNFSNPGTSLATPASFGKISSTVNAARVMQIAVRYDF